MTYIECDRAEERIVNEYAAQSARLRAVCENDAVLGVAAPLQKQLA